MFKFCRNNMLPRHFMAPDTHMYSIHIHTCICTCINGAAYLKRHGKHTRMYIHMYILRRQMYMYMRTCINTCKHARPEETSISTNKANMYITYTFLDVYTCNRIKLPCPHHVPVYIVLQCTCTCMLVNTFTRFTSTYTCTL